MLRFSREFRTGVVGVAFAVALASVAVVDAVPPDRSDDGTHDSSRAVANLEVADGLEVTLFASEPTIVSPTNIDVDARGRVWVCEVVNYRRNNGKRPEGDRILILEDVNGDGVADTTKVFYQGRDIDSAMGICVLGTRVIVSCSPNVFILHDRDGDDVADDKELLFTKTGQAQHDHSAHSFIFGPDGKLYWNFGNTGQHVHDREGNPVIDRAGNAVIDNGKPYRGGMVFRCDPDGSSFEVLAHNFRNNYEVAVDSFGTLWQSDNDDDGNRGVRINYVMEFGNFGYRDERTGAGWKAARTGMRTEVPERHWHLNDPGVVPNLLQTGAGSPCGICVYEGTLLPEVFRGQVIHCDAGPSVVRAYPASADGAGYRARVVNILEGTRNQWFRPADVCVAPDGSLFVSDWYDAGVGGHNQRDLGRGRIFRVAPPGHRYSTPLLDLETVDGAVKALTSPNLATRYLAWTALDGKGSRAEAGLRRLHGAGNPRHCARALWLLSRIPERGQAYVRAALEHSDADLRITAIRISRQLGLDVIPVVRKLARDPSRAVRRECILALRSEISVAAARLWAILAEQHDSKDRWYLEALGIGAHAQWDRCLDAWLDRVGKAWSTAAGHDIIWRSRATKSISYLERIIVDPRVPVAELPRYFRALDFLDGPEMNDMLTRLIFGKSMAGKDRERLILSESLRRLEGFDVSEKPEYARRLEAILDGVRGTATFVELVDKFGLGKYNEQLLEMALAAPEGQTGVDAARVLLLRGQEGLFRAVLGGSDAAGAGSAARVLGLVSDQRAVGLLASVVRDRRRPLEVRRLATGSMARSLRGAHELIDMATGDHLDESLHPAAAFQLNRAPWKDVATAAARLFPLPAARDGATLPPISRLLRLPGDVARGKAVFERQDTCIQCHAVAGVGKNVGPDLFGIGAKLSREALLESILFPSAGISHNYESNVVALGNGDVIVGIITSETPDALMIVGADAIVRKVRKAAVLERRRQDTSLMPADLQKLMTAQDLSDVVEYMTTLREKSPTGSS